MIPPRLGRLYCSSGVFFTRPLRVAIIRKWPGRSKSRTGMQSATFSPSCRLSRLTIARPFRSRLNCGRSNTFCQ